MLIILISSKHAATTCQHSCILFAAKATPPGAQAANTYTLGWIGMKDASPTVGLQPEARATPDLVSPLDDLCVCAQLH